MKTMELPVTISTAGGFSGDTTVEIEVSDKDARLILRAAEEYDDPQDCEELEGIYEKILKRVTTQVMEQCEEAEGLDEEDLEIWFGFPESLD